MLEYAFLFTLLAGELVSVLICMTNINESSNNSIFTIQSSTENRCIYIYIYIYIYNVYSKLQRSV